MKLEKYHIPDFLPPFWPPLTCGPLAGEVDFGQP